MAITNTHSVGLVRDAADRLATEAGSPAGHLVGAARRGRDLRRLPERHQRLPREGGARVPRPSTKRAAGRWRRQRRRRHRHGVLRVQGRHRHGVAAARRQAGGYTVGVLVQANFGRRAAAPGRRRAGRARRSRRTCRTARSRVGDERRGGIDHRRGGDRRAAPAASARTRRPARLARPRPDRRHRRQRIRRHLPRVLHGQCRQRRARPVSPASACWPTTTISAAFEATVQATEEAIVNALVAGETMVGIDGHRVIGLPHDRLRDVLRRHVRLITR